MAAKSVYIIITPPNALSPQQIEKGFSRGMAKSAVVLEGAVKDAITPFTRTGALRASVRVKSQTSKQIIITAGSNLNYARFVDEGFRAHMIRPRSKKALAWPKTGQTAAGLGRGPGGTSKNGGSLAFAKYVWHPGFKGHHYLDKAWKAKQNEVKMILQTELAAALNNP